jgi:hypothetical protein
MKPYEEIDFPNGFLRWIREDGEYVCRMTEEQMEKFKALHKAPRTWVGLTELEKAEITSLKWWDWEDTFDIDGFVRAIEAKLKEKNL